MVNCNNVRYISILINIFLEELKPKCGRGPLIKRVYVRRNDQGQREMGQGAHDVNTTEGVNVTVRGTDTGN